MPSVANIRNGSDSFWWAQVTVKTVGYGDYVPATSFGCILAIVLMIFGISIFAVLTSFLAAGVIRLQSDPEDIAAIVKQEAAIRAELVELKEIIKAGANKDDAEE